MARAYPSHRYMARPKHEVQFGPWPLGVDYRRKKNSNDGSAEQIINFDVEDDGTLTQRRPLQVIMPLFGSKFLKTLGTYTKTATGAIYGIFGYQAGVNITVFPYTDGTTTVNIQTSAGVNLGRSGSFETVFNYNGKTYFVPSSVDTANSPVGFRSTDITAIPVSTTDVTAMPAGTHSCILHERAHIFDATTGTLYWSNSGDPDTWAAPNGGSMKIEPGDEPFTAMAQLGDTIYLFKRYETFAYTFQTDPAIDFDVRKVSAQHGALACTVHRNRLYIVNNNSVYELLNGQFIDLGAKLDLLSNTNIGISNTGTFLQVLGNTLLLYGVMNPSGAPNYGGSPTSVGNSFMYAMNINTGAWSSYDFSLASSGSYSPIPTDRGLEVTSGSNANVKVVFGQRFVPNATMPQNVQINGFSRAVTAGVATRQDPGNVNIPGTLKTHPEYFGNSTLWKKFHRMVIDWAGDSRSGYTVQVTPLINQQTNPAGNIPVTDIQGSGINPNAGMVPVVMRQFRFLGIQVTIALTSYSSGTLLRLYGTRVTITTQHQAETTSATK